MVSPKMLYKIENSSLSARIWVDDPALIEIIHNQTGLSHVMVLESMNLVFIEFDPRYDKDEVMAELRQRLAAVYGIWETSLDGVEELPCPKEA